MSNNRFKFGKDRPYKTIEAAPYLFSFFLNERNLEKGRADGTYLRISSRDSRQFSVNIPGNSETYGYLLAAANTGDASQLLDYARIVFSVSMLLTTDQTFVNDICKALTDWQERRMADGLKNAGEVTDGQELVAQAFMEDVAEFADAKTDNERDGLRKEWKEEVRREIEKTDDITD